jgi:hypothetical protein
MRLVTLDERVKTPPSKTPRRGAYSAPAASTLTWPGGRRGPTPGAVIYTGGIPMRRSPPLVTKSDEEPTSLTPVRTEADRIGAAGVRPCAP